MSAIPTIVVMLLAFHYFAIRAEVHRISAYIGRIEEKLAPPFVRGWEKETWGKTLPLDYWIWIEWSTLVVGNFVGSIVLWCRFPTLRDISGSNS